MLNGNCYSRPKREGRGLLVIGGCIIDPRERNFGTYNEAMIMLHPFPVSMIKRVFSIGVLTSWNSRRASTTHDSGLGHGVQTEILRLLGIAQIRDAEPQRMRMEHGNIKL